MPRQGVYLLGVPLSATEHFKAARYSRDTPLQNDRDFWVRAERAAHAIWWGCIEKAAILFGGPPSTYGARRAGIA